MNPHTRTQRERMHSQTPDARSRARRPAGPLTFMIVLAAIIAIVGLSSCTAYTNAKTTSKTPGTGMLSANLTTVSFGTVGVGKATTQSVTVTNTGTSTVTIDQTAVTGASFTTGAGTPSATIAPGQSKTIQIQFAPLLAGSAAGSFTLTSNASNSPLTVELVGTGGQAGLAISPANFNFGSVQVGSTGSATITLTNSGNESVSINQASAAGTGFSAIGLAPGATIAAGQSTSFTAQFTPTTSGSATGSISVASNAPNSPLTVALSGSGSQAQISAIPSTAGFGNVST